MADNAPHYSRQQQKPSHTHTPRIQNTEYTDTVGWESPTAFKW